MGQHNHREVEKFTGRVSEQFLIFDVFDIFRDFRLRKIALNLPSPIAWLIFPKQRMLEGSCTSRKGGGLVTRDRDGVPKCGSAGAWVRRTVSRYVGPRARVD